MKSKMIKFRAWDKKRSNDLRDRRSRPFMGALEAMTDTMGQTEREFSLVGEWEWKPFSPEYIDWIEAMPSVRAMELACALMYNYQVDEHDEQVDLDV